MKKTTSAFTLIETLVAISILIMALVGPLSIAEQSLRSAYYSRDQVTAFYLAQEGIEYVRGVRDQNYLTGQSWLNGVTDCQGAKCVVDFPNFTHTLCPNNICPAVLISSSGGLFNQTSGTPSKFTRILTLTPVAGSPDQMIVGVTVSWTSGAISRTFTLNERLFNWL
jgi:type II secretory pathway pseudopilin PulG